MFTGIVESMGEIVSVTKNLGNLRATITCDFVSELQIDQSIAHDGVCLTVVDLNKKNYAVDIIAETLQKSNLANWKAGQKINLERSLTLQKPLDGHIVQGHVDTVFTCSDITDENGSTKFTFAYDEKWGKFMISKGSICINGVSLTIAHLTNTHCSVAIIPYTFAHTSFQSLTVGSKVNIEFDVVGKYINRIAEIQS